MKFEIKKQEYVNKTFRIPKELADKLAVAATNNDVFINKFVVQACEFALKHLNVEEQD